MKCYVTESQPLRIDFIFQTTCIQFNYSQEMNTVILEEKEAPTLHLERIRYCSKRPIWAVTFTLMETLQINASFVNVTY